MSKEKKIPKWLVKPPKKFQGEAKINVHGGGEPQVMKVVFVHKGKLDAIAWWEQAKTSEKLVVDLLPEIISGFVDDEGNEQPATKEDLAYLMDNYPTPFADLVNSWFDNLFGARLKN